VRIAVEETATKDLVRVHIKQEVDGFWSVGEVR
jgi:hypothetical protein